MLAYSDGTKAAITGTPDNGSADIVNFYMKNVTLPSGEITITLTGSGTESETVTLASGYKGVGTIFSEGTYTATVPAYGGTYQLVPSEGSSFAVTAGSSDEAYSGTQLMLVYISSDEKTVQLNPTTGVLIQSTSDEKIQLDSTTGTFIVPAGASVTKNGTTETWSKGGTVSKSGVLDPVSDNTVTVKVPSFDGSYAYGYEQPEAKSITISSSGNTAAAIKSVALTDGDTDDFVIGGSGSSVPQNGSITSWTVRPVSGLTVGTYTAEIEVTYDDDKTATATVSFTVTQAAQDAPSAAPELANRTTSSITLKEITANENGAAAEYGISTDGGKNWTWQASPEFTGLSSGTEYTFAVRFGATGVVTMRHPRPSAGETIATLPNAPAAAVTIDYRAETLTFDSIYEVSTDMDFGTGTLISSGGSISSCVPSYGSEGLTLYVRVKADGNIPAGEIQTFTIPARQQTPTDLMPANETLASEGDGRISGVNEHMEYRQGDTGEWTACTGTTINNLTPGTYCVRVAATQSGFASAAVTVVIATGAERTYMLNITAPTFDRVYAGYTQPEAQPITIINTGNSDATIIGVTLTGDVNAFILSVKDGAIITAGSTDNTTYTIRPAGGLSAGTYTATITIAYNNDTQASADVSFTVSRRSTGSNTPTYPPTVEKTDNGSTDVAPANPRQGAKVTITPKPDEGYETAGVTVTDSKGSRSRSPTTATAPGASPSPHPKLISRLRLLKSKRPATAAGIVRRTT